MAPSSPIMIISGEATGTPSNQGNDEGEDIEVLIVNTKDALNILYTGEQVGARCAMYLGMFVARWNDTIKDYK